MTGAGLSEDGGKGAIERSERGARHPRSTQPAITVLVVDDHRLFAEGIARLLGDEPDFAVVGVAETAAAGVAAVASLRPHVVLLGMALPDMEGLACAARVQEVSPATRVVLMGDTGDEILFRAAVAAGCVGYVDTHVAFAELSRAVRLGAAGEIALAPGQLRMLVPEATATAIEVRQRRELTSRELEVLELIGQGLANKEIARRLGLRINTVRNHVQRILTKLHAHSKLEAFAIASQRHMLAATRPPP